VGEKNLFLKIISLLLLLMIVPISASSVANAQQGEIVIGIVTDRTGALSYYGDMSINGFILGLMYALNISTFQTITPNLEWKLDWQGRTIHIIAETNTPSGSQVPDPTTAVSAAQDLILNKGAQILVGCADSASAIALTQIALKYRVVFLVTPAADSDITSKYLNRYVFQISSTTWHDALAGAAYAVTHMGKTFAFLAPNNPWGKSTVSTWSAVINSYNGTVLAEEYAPVTATDFTPYIQAILASKAQVFIPVWAGATALTLYQQINASGIYQKMNVTSGIPDLATLNLLAMGLYLPNYVGMMKYAWNLPQNNSVNQWLVNKYVSLYKNQSLPTMGSVLAAFPLPDLFVGEGFVAGQALGLALQKTGGSTNADALISALENLSFYSVKGEITIRKEDHRTIQDMYIAKIIWDNTTLSKYYNVTELPQIYQPFMKTGIFAPLYIETIPRVTPPIEANLYPATTTTTTTPTPTTTLPTTSTPTVAPVANTTTLISSPTGTTTQTETAAPSGMSWEAVAAILIVVVIIIAIAIYLLVRRR